ncbi:MAG TPA: RNB domain-containing ribonuclease, partial [Solirubrobacteraceae bacterium]|nr:RNB domain-containing ribonuclease [Solirubrobacteraceae bacterium]
GGSGGSGSVGAKNDDARVVWPPQQRQPARSLIAELMRERGLPRGFERHVERAARRARDRGLDVHGDLDSRRDLTGLATFTIDPISARDFDDAISAQALGGERVRVWVHIADVSAYVPEGSPVDEEALRRATSVYVPGAVAPMLPQALSNDACSLVPARERLAVTVELELNGAEIASAAFYRSVIRSDERLHYERVDRIFAGDERASEPWAEPLAAARAAAAALQRARERGGALVIDSEEPEFRFDARGEIVAIDGRAQTESHRLIEHLMIAANEAVARLLEQRRTPCLYRVHERPEPERIERLVAQLATLDVPTPPLPERMSSTQAAELLGELSRAVERHAQRAGYGRRALSALVLRSLKQAYYSPRNLGHAGLRAMAYCHFTSPIRRYPDLVCHRALLSGGGGGERAPRRSELASLGEWTSERERDAMKIERDADDVAACSHLERALYENGWERELAGEVVGVIGAGAFVAFTTDDDLRDAVYEGLLPVRELHTPSGEREWWELNEEGTILRGERSGTTLRLGDAVTVRVARVDVPRGRVDLLPALAEQPVGAKPPARGKPPTRAKRPRGG